MSDGRDWIQFESDCAAELLLGLAEWVPGALADREIDGFWFVQKPPGLRLRFADARSPATIRARLRTHCGPLHESVYLPETFLFDGPSALRHAHDAFTADSLAVVAYARLCRSGQARPEPADFSISIVERLLAALPLDAWERWDVWMRLHSLRGGDWRDVAPRARETLSWQGCQAIERDYAARIEALARRIGNARVDFPSGLRPILPFWIAFHWNRMGFGAAAQRRLAARMAANHHPRAAIEAMAEAWAAS
jgi:thiopeptide-type bacteriocin biosynthesis protein